MNCKIGDIAVIIRAGTTSANLGKLVVVLESDDRRGWWVVESIGGPLPTLFGISLMRGSIQDSRLKPLRDNPGEDETLRIITLETA